MNKYKIYVVIDGNEHATEGPYVDEETAQETLTYLRGAGEMWIGLENGDMVAFNKHFSSNIYFKAKRVYDDEV